MFFSLKKLIFFDFFVDEGQFENFRKRKMSELKTFHRFFTYEKIKKGKDKSIGFVNCTLLKDMDPYKKGQKVSYIGIQMQFFMWQDDKDFEEYVEIY